jgi:predicted GTPase
MINLKPSHPLDMTIKGIASDPVLFHNKINQARFNQHLLKWKQNNDQLPLIIVLSGGTGTGKSTLFNALIEKNISAESVKRPTTSGGIAYVQKTDMEPFQDHTKTFPFKTKIQSVNNDKACLGTGKTLTIVPYHESSVLPVLIDSPDVDSVCIENKKHAQKLFLLADVIIYITSSEKYADQEPLAIIQQAKTHGKQLIIVLNKCEDQHLVKSIHHQLQEIVHIEDFPFFVIPRRKETSDPNFLEAVNQVKNYVFKISKHSRRRIKNQDSKSLSNSLNQLMSELQKKRWILKWLLLKKSNMFLKVLQQ